ncbi:MAG: hypothetical protein KIT84_13015 [Labilithrix sp.]|nr:hypothetical protein [Labilithrix sp.]MCW5811936.1 hypothetical protein [Labilithrix sp.]
MRATRAAVLACALVALPRLAFADEPPPPPPPPPAEASADKPIVVWPTLTPAPEDTSGGTLHRAAPAEGSIYERATELDATIRDAVQDLGFALDVADAGPAPNRARDLDMVERAQHSAHKTEGTTTEDDGTWVVSARLEPAGTDSLILRILAVAPRSKQIRMRVERVAAADVAVRGLVLLRDLLTTSPVAATDPGPRPQESAGSGIMAPSRSPGRAVLAANAALFGAFMAFSVQRASGSTDPRLLYPLLTLGTGVGLGSALLVAEEFNVTTGDAWTIAGGAWWGTAAGILIANGRRVALTDRYAWGVGGGIIGLGLATFSLTRHKADEGDAVLVHSGAGLGLGLGALADFFYRGDLVQRPYTGAGYGAAIGLVGGGTIATFAKVPPSRMMLIDLGAGLGAAAGAAIGSPLVFEKVTAAKTRGFVGATFGGTLAGGITAWWLTRDKKPATAPRSGVRVVPYGGTIGATPTKDGAVPAYGLGVNGVF